MMNGSLLFLTTSLVVTMRRTRASSRYMGKIGFLPCEVVRKREVIINFHDVSHLLVVVK